MNFDKEKIEKWSNAFWKRNGESIKRALVILNDTEKSYIDSVLKGYGIEMSERDIPEVNYALFSIEEEKEIVEKIGPPFKKILEDYHIMKNDFLHLKYFTKKIIEENIKLKEENEKLKNENYYSFNNFER